MTHREDLTPVDRALAALAEEGFDGMAEAIAVSGQHTRPLRGKGRVATLMLRRMSARASTGMEGEAWMWNIFRGPSVVVAALIILTGTAVASVRLSPGPHHHRTTNPTGPWIPFNVSEGGLSFMWGSPEREYVFVPTNPQNPEQGYYKTTNNGRTVGAIYFSSSSGQPPSGTYTATGVAGQGGDYVRSSVPPP